MSTEAFWRCVVAVQVAVLVYIAVGSVRAEIRWRRFLRGKNS